MNILELSKPFNHGGLADHIVTLSYKLKEKGHNVMVVSEPGNHVEVLKSRGIEHIATSFTVKNPYAFFSTVRKLKKLIKERNIDVVHCHYRACSLYMRYLQVFCGVKVPFVWTNHLFDIPSGFIYKKFTFTGDRVIAVSEELKGFLTSKLGIDGDKIEVVNTGVEPVNLTPAIDEEERAEAKRIFGVEGKTVCSLLGRLVEVKGHGVAIEALDRLKDRADLVMLFAGIGPDEYKRELENKISKKGLSERIFFIGQQSARQILLASDIMILPSLKEGCPISVFESFAMKVPVVRTKTSGYTETADLCVSAEIGDSAGFAEGIGYILDNPDKRVELVEKAHTAVLNNWTTEKITTSILSIYESVINARRGLK